MPKIDHIEITLDDNVPDYMEGIIRIGSAISYDSNDNEICDYQDLVNEEANAIDSLKDAKNELINIVAKHANVSPSIVSIVD